MAALGQLKRCIGLLRGIGCTRTKTAAPKKIIAKDKLPAIG